MATSELQQRTFDELRLLLQAVQVKENYRPDWLKNPRTGHNLELDFYLPDLEMAIEVQGQQHIQRVPFFQETQEDFRQRLVYDRFKRLKCLERGIELFEVFAINDISPFLEQARARNSEVAFILLKRDCAMRALSWYAAELGRKFRAAPERADKCVRQIVHICEEYNIPILSVRPDLTIRKADMDYSGKSIVAVYKLFEDRIVDGERAALLRWDFSTGVCTCRWHSKKAGKQYQDAEFDMTTGREADATDPHWQIKPQSMPEWFILQMERRGLKPAYPSNDDVLRWQGKMELNRE